MATKVPWANYSEERLLQFRLKDLNLHVRGTWVHGCLLELNEELKERGIRIRPHAWVSTEWFSPDTTPGVAIPFYLLHPRLMRLEKKMIIDVEGGTVPECMRILRHEMGHVLQHSYKLHRRRKWQELFGASSQRYPSYYRPNPASKHFVQHLRLWYAQSHPDEDFAETFAVWLKPRSNWKKRYEGWAALKKLQYVDELMREIADERPSLRRRLEVEPLRSNRMTLREHYKKKQALYAVDSPGKSFDRDLFRIFSADPKHRNSQPASAFIRRNRAELRSLVSRWTGEYQLTIDSLLDEMIKLCRAMNLRAPGNERQIMMNFAVLLAARTVHSLFGPARRQWFAL